MNRTNTEQSIVLAGRVPPQNIDAEQSILGAIMQDPEAMVKISDRLQADDFYRDDHRVIFGAMLELFEKRKPIDALTLTDTLESKKILSRAGGATYVAELIGAVNTSAHLVHHADIVRHKAMLRKLISAASRITELGYKEDVETDEILDQAESAVLGVSQRFINENFVSISSVLSESFDRIDELHKHKGTLRGVPTGFKELDNLLGGLQKSDLVIIAARPSMGKTSFAINIAEFAAIKAGKTVGVFSLEQSRDQLVDRMLSSQAELDSWQLRTGNLADEDFHRLSEAMGVLSEAPIYIDDSPGMSPLEIRTKARRLQSDHGLDLIIVDYLQLITGHNQDNRVQEVSEISRSLKALARELNVPVIALSQLSRAVESRPDKRPMLSDLRDSGCLTGDTLIQRADTGERVQIRDLVGLVNVPVMSLDKNLKLKPAVATKIFSSGRKKVFALKLRSGRTIKASSNHQFYALSGWKRLDELAMGEKVAVLEAPALTRLAESDIRWDAIVAIEPLGVEEVFDASVPGTHNFVANDIVVHNSIEQDADVVMFIYRDDYYNRDSEQKNIAEILVRKHRNGPIGQTELYFHPEQTRFRNLEKHK